MRSFGSALCILALIGCSQMPASPSFPAERLDQPGPKKSQFQALYSFKGEPDGAVPAGILLDLHGTLYGTTNYGGDSSGACYPGNGCGTVFTFASGKESVLYRFKAKTRGLRPFAGLTNVKGTLYGTTQEGGKYNDGAVFAITAAGSEKALFSFNGNAGGNPRATLTNVDGVLFGTTYFGGTSGDGTVFSITTSGKEHVIHSFAGTDGAFPVGSLIAINGALYGTTLSGGSSNSGTVFQIDSKGKEHVLHSFGVGADGAHPWSELTNVNGAFFGTTKDGGSAGDGTVFKVATNGSERVLYSFSGGTDGAHPYAGLTPVNGLFYGNTAYGGDSNNDGTIYSVTTSGTENVLYRFTGGSGGRLPYATLVALGKVLFGTTLSGGGSGNGEGTVFQFTP